MRSPHLVLVHGEINEMNRLKAAIIRQYEDDADFHIEAVRFVLSGKTRFLRDGAHFPRLAVCLDHQIISRKYTDVDGVVAD
uniref:RMMBL domain-containing protein n=1 Tax=Ascaris lumbricoides TaxID=6252 RepID=A0A0M3HG58_ASCLU